MPIVNTAALLSQAGVSVPFTPQAGRACWATPGCTRTAVQAALALARETGVSSLHLLFPYESQALEMQQQGLMLRRGVQLHWRNPAMRLCRLSRRMRRDKRKKINQDGAKSAMRHHLEHVRGEQITAQQWEFLCAVRTHACAIHSPQPLNLAFFQRIGTTMPQQFCSSLRCVRASRLPVQ